MNIRFDTKHTTAEPPIDLLMRLAHTERHTGAVQPPQPATRKRWLLPVVAVLVIGTSAALSALVTMQLLDRTDRPQPSGLEAPSSKAASISDSGQHAASTAETSAVLEASGYIVARNKSTVSSDITGRIKSIDVVVGQMIAKGTVIASLDDREARLRLTAAEIKLTQDRLAAENARVIVKHEQQKVAQLGDLAAQKFVSDAAYKQAVTTLESATIQVKTADANLADGENALLAARIFVERHTIRAPFAGVVSAVSASPGETVSPTSGGGNSFIRSGIVQLVDSLSLYVVAEVQERHVGPIHVGQPVEIAGKSANMGVFASAVTWVSPVSNRQRGVVEVGINLTQSTRRFIDGMEVNVRFMEKKNLLK